MDAAPVVLLMEAGLAPMAEVSALPALTAIAPEDPLQGLTDHLLISRTLAHRSLATAEKASTVRCLLVPPMVATLVTRMAVTPICTPLEAPVVTVLLLFPNILEVQDLVAAALFPRPNSRTRDSLPDLATSEVAAAQAVAEAPTASLQVAASQDVVALPTALLSPALDPVSDLLTVPAAMALSDSDSALAFLSLTRSAEDPILL